MTARPTSKHHHVSIFSSSLRVKIQEDSWRRKKVPILVRGTTRTQRIVTTIVRKGQKDLFGIILGRSDGNSDEDYKEAGYMKKDKDFLERRQLLSPPDVEGGDQGDQQDTQQSSVPVFNDKICILKLS